MQKINVNWCGIFNDAYTYSSNYLLLSLTIVIASILWVWIYENPQFYKLIFKKSKHSNILSPTHSDQEVADEFSNLDNELSITVIQKRLAEISRNTLLSEKETRDADITT
nr:uncharacterized protein LOC116772424 [Danaus plexippus plexippus]